MPDRKYRQRGYQDSQSKGSGGSDRGPSVRPERPEGPRGRGVGAHRDEVFRCKRCGERADADVKPESKCRKCGSDLHACVQCRHFDTLARFQCRQQIPAAIVAKSNANDCALYEPAISMDLKGSTSVDTPDQARSAFDKLFGKK